MRFLDLDLDFFLNKNAYSSGDEGGRLGLGYKPWSAYRVRRFLEGRCGLSHYAPVQGRTIETHDGIIDFWNTLIESSRLKIPFEVIHIDAHPDLWVGGGLYQASGFLHIDPEHGQAILKGKHIHPGNYLTFAIAFGWIGSLVWVPLLKRSRDLPKWDADARSILIQLKKRKDEGSPIRDLPISEKEPGVPYKILPWNTFRTSETFDYIALSKSPDFTASASDELIPIIEGYITQI